MKIKGLVHEDFINYKKPSMFISLGTCDWKCAKDGGFDPAICQNSPLAKASDIEVDLIYIYNTYINNPITSAIVFGGLETMTQFDDIYEVIKMFRDNDCHDDVVIYTGFYPNEVGEQLKQLAKFDNIIIKFGRFIPNVNSKFDKVLGITLASDNQYAYYLNQDSQDTIQAMIDNGSYCPCMIKKNDNTKCSCLAFRKQESGKCHCGIFSK